MLYVYNIYIYMLFYVTLDHKKIPSVLLVRSLPKKTHTPPKTNECPLKDRGAISIGKACLPITIFQGTSWRIIPLRIRGLLKGLHPPFITFTNPILRGLTITIVTNHLQVMGCSALPVGKASGMCFCTYLT